MAHIEELGYPVLSLRGRLWRDKEAQKTHFCAVRHLPDGRRVNYRGVYDVGKFLAHPPSEGVLNARSIFGRATLAAGDILQSPEERARWEIEFGAQSACRTLRGFIISQLVKLYRNG